MGEATRVGVTFPEGQILLPFYANSGRPLLPLAQKCSFFWRALRAHHCTRLSDRDGTGFVCDDYYQIYLDECGAPLNSDSDTMLDGSLRVGYARVLELRKLNGKKRMPRLSVRPAPGG